jgi:ribonuclease VapC
MLIDASALVAVLAREPDAQAFAAPLETETYLRTHPLSVWEASLAIIRLNEVDHAVAVSRVEALLTQAKVEVLSCDHLDAVAAVLAHQRYGRRRHPAALNMADCFSYAMAKRRGLKLLYKGDDFAQTDIESALG